MGNDLKTRENFIKVLDYYGVNIDSNKDSHTVLCPHHDDHKPSLVISLATNGCFKCHAGCGEGDMFSFVAMMEGLDNRTDFQETLKKTKEICGKGDDGEALIATYIYKVDGRVVNTKYKFLDKHLNKTFRWHTSKAQGGEFPIYNTDALKGAAEIIVAEGEKDCNTLTDNGITAVSFPHGADTVKEEYITPLLHMKKIYIAYDNDGAGEKGRDKIIKLLNEKQFLGQIFIVQWGEKKVGYDVTDWFKENGVADKVQLFYELFHEQPKPKHNDSLTLTIPTPTRAKGNNILATAHDLVDRYGLKTVYGRLHYKRGNIYVPFENSLQIRNLVLHYLQENGNEASIKKFTMEEIIYFIESFDIVPSEKVNPEYYFPVQNGFLEINANGLIELREDVQPIFTFSSRLPYLPNYDTEKITEFLSLTIPDETIQRHLLEACAIAIFPSLRFIVNFKHFLILYGTGDNGKSILCDNIIPPIIGQEAISNIRFKNLSSKFSLSQIVGRRLNISTENDTPYIEEEENLKSLTSGDSQEYERKYCSPFTARVFVVLMFCLNDEPQFGRISYAMKNRIKIVPFPNRFTTNPEDPRFLANPDLKNINSDRVKELQQGMLALLIKTAERLYKERKLTDANLSTIEELQKASSHLREFVDEYFIFDKKSAIPSNDVFNRYYRGGYCTSNDLYDPDTKRWTDPSRYDTVAKTAAQLSRRLRLLFPDQVSLEKKAGDRFIRGISRK